MKKIDWEKFKKVELPGLRWVIGITFDTADELKEFAAKENLNIENLRKNHTTICAIED